MVGRSRGAASSRDGGDDQPRSGTEGRSSARRSKSQRNILIGLAGACEFWHDANRVAFASFAVNDHYEYWTVRSREFKIWLSGQFYAKTGEAIRGLALEDGIRILEARAIHEGLEYQPFIRTGYHGGKLYLDLCDRQWRAVEISAHSWQVIQRPPVKLLRSPSMRSLPEPEGGALIEELRRFVNVRSDDDFTLLVAWLVTTLRPGFDTIAIDKLLAHQPTKLRGVAAIYQRYDFADERARALDAWAEHVLTSNPGEREPPLDNAMLVVVGAGRRSIRSRP